MTTQPESDQTNSQSRPRPWLIAAWPGVGNVAAIGAGYLVQSLDMKPIAEMGPRGHFDIQQVSVQKGVIKKPRLPRNVFYVWKNPDTTKRDLVLFLGEAQPSVGAYAFAHELLDRASAFNIERVFTFASLASQLHPTATPSVAAVATDKATLQEAAKHEVRALRDGEIGGLNGVILGAAAEKGLTGLCLLGEIPFFAAGVPNPKAAMAVLKVFGAIAGIEIDTEDLSKHADAVEEALMDLMERMKQEASKEGNEVEVEAVEEDETEDHAAPATPEKEPSPALDYDTRQKIEELFDEARKDRNRSLRLKQELDRLGVFKLYENRFLDLFRRAG